MRGPVRLLRSQMAWNDFLSPYIQADAFLHGKNPYLASNILVFWPSDNPLPAFVVRDTANGSLPAKRGIPSLYPVTSLVLLAPLTFLRWPAAEILWIALNTATLLLALGLMVEMSGVDWGSLRVYFFLAAALALAPLHTGLGLANPAVLAIALTIAVVWAGRTGREHACGVLLAFALCLKPTIAFALLFYYVLRRRWRILAVVAAVTGVIAAIGAGWMSYEKVPWLTSYFANNRQVLAPGGLADFTSADPLRFNLVNTQVLFCSLFGSISVARWLSLLLAAALITVWLLFRQRNVDSPERLTPREFLDISTLLVLSLLPVYHRFYDAGLLLWPVAWATLLVRRPRTQFLTMSALGPFFLPGAAILDRWREQGHIPSRFTDRWWWNMFVMPHEIWCLLVLSALLLLFMIWRQAQAAHPGRNSRAQSAPSLGQGRKGDATKS